ncbi:glutamate-rich protein 2 isoform X1 [Epinephelus fuscoguttatus]|uniref:glutamate-rich protein 2 isoform X1 n=1 Tax=Epinephelus fuscoguttatus TaxID=293821 RepID=UPI0020D0D8C5|nr:glutamate-rich protein 2 isoform X1 [Epinephelus fuscoguttatus]
MSRLECLGTSSTSSQKQVAAGVTSAHAETHKPKDKMERKAVSDKPRRSLPARAVPRSVQETQKSGLPSGEVQDSDERSPEELINISQRVEEHRQSTAAHDDELKMKDMRKTPGSALTGGAMHSPPPAEPLSAPGEEEQTEEEDSDDEDIKAPVELIMEFLRAVMDRDFQLASKLCQMILIYEPDNPEASEFLPLIHKKLLEDQEAEQSTEEDEDDDDDDDNSDSGSDEESSQSSSCSSSSCSSSSPSDDDEEEKQVNRHKPCPPSQIAP